MVKEIERFGIPIVHMATITTISQSVGANRIKPTVAIPYPVGKPQLADKEDEFREKLLDGAVAALASNIEESKVFK